MLEPPAKRSHPKHPAPQLSKAKANGPDTEPLASAAHLGFTNLREAEPSQAPTLQLPKAKANGPDTETLGVCGALGG